MTAPASGRTERRSAGKDISVVVPSYNSRTTIGRCLEALRGQRFDGEYEVIVVDSSHDGTGEHIEREFPWVKLIHLDERTLPGRARNVGVQEARAEIVAFTDADCVPAPDWLGRHRQAQRHHEVVGGALGNANPGSLVGWAGYLLEFSGYTPCRRRRGHVACLVSANISCHKELLRKYPFPEDLWPGEDRVLSWRLAGVTKLFYDGGIVVGHVNRNSRKDFFRHQVRAGRAAAAAWPRIGLHDRLCRHAWLAWLTPPWRGLVTVARVLRDTPRYLPTGLLVLPLILAGAAAWARGFHGAADGRRPA